MAEENIVSPTPQVPSETPAPTPAPVSTVPSPQPSPTDNFSLRSYATEHGYDPSQFQDERSLATALFRAASQYEEVEPLANIGRQFAPYVDKLPAIQEFLKAKEEEERKAAEEAAKSAAPAIEWRKADYDPEWMQYCKVDPETGRYAPRHPDWASYARKLNDAVEARQYNSQRVMSDLPGLLDQYYKPRENTLKEAILQEARELVRQELAQIQQTTATKSWIEEHSKDVYLLDASGAPVVGADGAPRLSRKGEALRAHAEELAEAGMTDPEKIRDYAWRAVSADEAAGKFSDGSATAPTAPTAPRTPAAPTAPAAQPRRFFDRLVGRNPGNGRVQQRAGSPPADDTAPAKPFQRRARPARDFREVFDEVNKAS